MLSISLSIPVIVKFIGRAFAVPFVSAPLIRILLSDLTFPRRFTSGVMMTDTRSLLMAYAADGSEDAFRELVARYLGLVYSTALRLVGGDTHRAEDVAQAVFGDLAAQARAIPPQVMLGGWLHQRTFNVATTLMRAERRRHARELEAMEMKTQEDHSGANLATIVPILDEAITQLKPEDRTAILLRFFERRDLRSIGQLLGTNEDAAQKRVSRALEKLRLLLERRGVALSATALATGLAAEDLAAAPASLVGRIAGTALASATAGSGAATLTQTLIVMSKLKLVISGLVVAAAATIVVIHYQTQAKLRAENEELRQRMAQLQSGSESPASQPVAKADSTSRSDERLQELLRLRGEVGVLRSQTNELASALAAYRRRLHPPDTRTDPDHPYPLSEDYPKTADAAAKGILEAWQRAEWDKFYRWFGAPGSAGVFDEVFHDPEKSNYLAGMEIVSIGQPTNNTPDSTVWYVPYTIQFQGYPKSGRLQVEQDPMTQRFFLKGGF
jgi:RNA polymerase sigma factor (sigma-70 family)